MNIYRINVKDELYFLAEDTNFIYEYDLFYKTIKEAQKNISSNSKGYVLKKNGMALNCFEKFGIVRCRELLEEYSDKPKEKESISLKFDPLTLQSNNYRTAIESFSATTDELVTPPATGTLMGIDYYTTENLTTARIDETINNEAMRSAYNRLNIN